MNSPLLERSAGGQELRALPPTAPSIATSACPVREERFDGQQPRPRIVWIVPVGAWDRTGLPGGGLRDRAVPRAGPWPSSDPLPGCRLPRHHLCSARTCRESGGARWRQAMARPFHTTRNRRVEPRSQCLRELRLRGQRRRLRNERDGTRRRASSFIALSGRNGSVCLAGRTIRPLKARSKISSMK